MDGLDGWMDGCDLLDRTREHLQRPLRLMLMLMLLSVITR
jgi:hypothetical protein